MGILWGWNAAEPDLRVQKRAAWFLESWANANDCGYLYFNGPVSGYFLDRDIADYRHDWQVVKKTTRHLLGVSLMGDAESLSAYESLTDVARSGQVSFIFDNTEGAGNQLITLEQIPTFEGKKYGWWRQFFAETPMDPQQDFYAVFQRGGQIHSIAVNTLLHWLEKEWLPTLDWSDPDKEFADFWGPEKYDLEVYEREFSPRVLDPRIQFRWR